MALDNVLQKEIEEKIIDIASEETGKDKKDIKRESRFVEDLGSDSLTNTEIVMRLEEAYNLKIEDTDAQKMITVGNAIDYITSHYAQT